MRIIIVTHYFPPEVGAPQARLSEMAAHWVGCGDEVTVVTGMPNHPTGVVPPAYRRRVRSSERVDGYRVLRSWLYATPNEGVVKKALGHLSFMVSSVLLNGRRAGPADVVVVSSPTFFSIWSAWLLARSRRARFVVEVRDLWPGIFVELGVLTNRMLIGLLERWELAAYKAADLVVVVTDGFRRNLLARGVPADKVHTIRNGVEPDRFRSVVSDRTAARRRLGCTDGETLVLYLGAHGISQGLATVAEAAGLLSDAPVRFAFVGDGAAKRKLADQVRGLGLDNVSLLPSVPRDEVPALLGGADVCLVPLRDVPLFSTFIPSKMFEFLAAGKAVVGGLRGEAAQLLAEAGGVVVPPEDPPALAAAVAELAGDTRRRQDLGRRGRAYVVEHCDRRRLAQRYRSLLAGLVEREGVPT